MGMKVVYVAKQTFSGRAAYETAVNTALGEALGWEVDDSNYVHHPKSNLKFKYYTYYNSAVYGNFLISNGDTEQSRGSGYVPIKYDASTNVASLNIYYAVSDYTTVVGFGSSASDRLCCGLITSNAAGDYAGLLFKPSANPLYIPNTGTATYTLPMCGCNTADMATSIIRLPDIVAGSVFSDLYMLYSCPAATSVYNCLDFTIVGKSYTSFPCCSSSGAQYQLVLLV